MSGRTPVSPATAGSDQPRPQPRRYPPDWPAPSVLDRKPRERARAPGTRAGRSETGPAAERARALLDALRPARAEPTPPPSAREGEGRARLLVDALRPSKARQPSTAPADGRLRIVVEALRPGRRPHLATAAAAPAPAAPLPRGGADGSPLRQWERENRSRLERLREAFPAVNRRNAAIVTIFLAVGLAGMAASQTSTGIALEAQLRQRLAAAELSVEAREGEIAVLRVEMDRLRAVAEHSTRYRIPMDLAGQIYDAALAESVDPALGFALVDIESQFYWRAVSPVGAVGLAQVMPRTAYGLDPTLEYAELFAPETNLRLGFRYLRLMLDRYGGDLRLALLAYNRGPGTVDSIRREGGDPANGYARAVLGSAARP